MKRHLVLIIAVVMVLAFAQSAFADRFVVYDFKSKSSLKSDARTMAKLLRSDLDKLSETKIITVPAASCSSISCARKTLRQKNADAVVIGEIDYLGSKMYLFVKAVWDSEVISYEIPLAGVEEFARVSERLAKSIKERKTFESEMAMDSVTHDEKDPFAIKQKGDFSLGLSVGAWAPLSDSYLGAGGLYNFYIQLKYEVADLGFELDTGYVYGNSPDLNLSIREYAVDFSVLYYFAKRDRTPFIGGVFGLHGIKLVDNDNGSVDSGIDKWAPVMGGFVGYEFGRAQMFSFHVRLGYKAQYLNLNEYSQDEIAHGPFLGIGVSFF